MKNFKKLMMLATVACIAQQSTIANNKTADDAQPTHQGVGRLGTFFENTLTLHPGNAVNALVTGDQSDTTFGWHENEEGRIKANRADTEHNNNKNVKTNIQKIHHKIHFRGNRCFLQFLLGHNIQFQK